MTDKKIEFFYPNGISQETIENLYGKSVDFVFYKVFKSHGGQEWKGELSTGEYFQIGYLKGKLVVSVAERETQFEKNAVYIGYTDESNNSSKTKVSANSWDSLMKEITEAFSPKPSNITLDDILNFLGWNKKSNLEITQFIY